jgi:hypothetical protein
MVGEATRLVFVDDAGSSTLERPEYYSTMHGRRRTSSATPDCVNRENGYVNRASVTTALADRGRLPFRQRIAYYMELFSARPRAGFPHARIVYNYARRRPRRSRKINDEDLRPMELPPTAAPGGFVLRDAAIYAVEDLVRRT